MQVNEVKPYQRWHWAGDHIVQDTVVKASRRVPGTRKRYDIDIREYLGTTGNAVVRRKLLETIGALPAKEQALFLSEQRGSFDFRADRMVEKMSQLEYLPTGRKFDHWMFPEETLANGGGDCEDLAFLLAALLEAAGISEYCIRVALGEIKRNHPTGEVSRSDHAWVVYLNEAGAWEILEPLAILGKKHLEAAAPKKAEEIGDLEYTPHFVFNRSHLWRVRGPDERANRALMAYLDSRQFWEEFKPAFAAQVHADIYDAALVGMVPADLKTVKRVSLMADVDVLAYDPRDHFDFAYLDEGWERALRRLGSGNLRDFAYAVHAIGDFYAHTFYADFAQQDPAGNLMLYDPVHPNLKTQPSYDFSRYAPLPGCAETPQQAATTWNGRLISGQWWRWFTTFPDDLENNPGFPQHRCLPDHDQVAVDGASPKKEQRHYSGDEYTKQFKLRYAAAVEHIRQVYGNWRASPAAASG
jgi:hypothetical protein